MPRRVRFPPRTNTLDVGETRRPGEETHPRTNKQLPMAECVFALGADGVGDIKTWMAPALGCVELRKEQHTDKLLSSGWVNDWIQVEQAVSVRFISVDQYFYVPPSYTETAMGDLMVKLHESSPGLHPVFDAAKIQKLNAAYYAHRPWTFKQRA
jgi:hypothetical protein